MDGNGRLAAAVALVHRGTGTRQEWRDTLIPVADAILARLGLTPDELKIVLTADKWRDRPQLGITGPVPETPEEDLRIAEAAAARASAELILQQAFDRRLVADAAVSASRRRGKEPSPALLEAARESLRAWETAREALQRAMVRLTEAQRARNYRRAAPA